MIAARTKRIKMGPSVLTLSARPPVHVAKTYATLDCISGGRMLMAVGGGSDLRDLAASGAILTTRFFHARPPKLKLQNDNYPSVCLIESSMHLMMAN